MSLQHFLRSRRGQLVLGLILSLPITALAAIGIALGAEVVLPEA